jgi:hypothetical protein
MAATTAYRCVFDFSCETGQGWTETWYQLNVSSLLAALANAENLFALRCQIMGNGSHGQTYRVFDPANPRLSQQRNPFIPAPPSFAAATDNPVSSQLGICKCNPSTGTRQLWCRGIPDSWVVFDTTAGLYTLIGAFKKAFQNFADFISSGNWALKVVSPKIPMAPLSSKVLSITQDPVTGYTALTLDAGTWVSGQTAVVSGFKFPLQSLNGQYKYNAGYSSTGPTNFIYRNRSTALIQNLTYRQTANVRVASFTYPAITSCIYQRPGDRRVGKLLGLPRGRRSSK